ncbi:PD40 domain-containing protein [Candidatus Poribacteria bacterium]|nr:PD40 domain-containing protein [Candidatus Poribacteria bacterium]
MNIKILMLFCCISLLFFKGVVSVIAEAPKTAKIVFTSTRDGDDEIYIMNADGSQQKNLTLNGARDGSPVWSPTGEHIAFHSDRHGIRDIYIMDADGKNVRKVLKDVAYREFPTWSPDGKKLAYHRAFSEAIYTADINERSEKHVVSSGRIAGFPAWSPDGSEIVFTYRFPHDVGRTVLRVINVNTHEETTLFEVDEPATLIHTAWSPDGNKIAFLWSQKGIYVLDRDGSGLKKLVTGSSPAWSPLGDKVLYISDGIFTFDLGSRKSEQLTGDGNYEADWFNPAALPVQPDTKLLTTIWGQLKQK